MTAKSRLHASALLRDDGTWAALPPHAPSSECYGKDGGPCPEAPENSACRHHHQHSQAALRCSRSMPPFDPDKGR